MKLLFDENLAPALCALLSDVFPDSVNVLSVGLGGQRDEEVAIYAARNGYVVVTKDADFVDLALSALWKLKVVRITLGNCTVESIYILLRNTAEVIATFAEGEDLVLEMP